MVVTGIEVNNFTKLSKAEKTILMFIAEYKTTNDIASELNLSTKTIKNHRHNICEKLNLPQVNNALLAFTSKYNKTIVELLG